MINIILMAGEGSRFNDVGYLLPKPLIPINNTTMIHEVIKSCPSAISNIFIVRQQHINKFKIDKYLRTLKHGCHIIPVKRTTSGQASTAMLAKDFFNNMFYEHQSLFIASCDCSININKDKFKKLQSKYDCIVFTFTKQQILKTNPKAWGWCVVKGNDVVGMSVKIPISKKPFYDHAVTGNFYFKNFSLFKIAYAMMRKDKDVINGEYYIDRMPYYVRKLGLKVGYMDVGYTGWGTPEQLYDYQLKEYMRNVNEK